MKVGRRGSAVGFLTVGHRKKLQEKKQEKPYFTLKYKENSGFPGVALIFLGFFYGFVSCFFVFGFLKTWFCELLVNFGGF